MTWQTAEYQACNLVGLLTSAQYPEGGAFSDKMFVDYSSGYIMIQVGGDLQKDIVVC